MAVSINQLINAQYVLHCQVKNDHELLYAIGQYTIQYNNSICRALFTKRPGALTETSDDMLCEIVQSLNGA